MKPTEIKNVITEILESRKEEGGIKALYFVGCGGSNGALYPAKTFMERECANIKSALINSNEFVYSTPKDLGKNVIVCLSCHKGNTPETINAAKLAKEKGAAVIILTWKEESEITPFGDYIINYTFGDNKDIAGEKIICALLVAVELLNQTEGYEHYEEFMDGVGRIDGIVKHACKHVEKRAELFAKEYKDDKLFILWQAERVMVQHICKVYVFLWKCSGFILPVFTVGNFSMDLSKLQIKKYHLCFRFLREPIDRWMNEH